MRDVCEERLLAAARAFDLRRHVVERSAHLCHLGRAGDRHARAVVALGEALRRPSELAQGSRDRAREQPRDDEREAGRDDARDDERWEEDAQRVGERGAGPRDDDDRGGHARRVRAEDLLVEEPLVALVVEGAEVPLRRPIERLIRERGLAVDEHAASVGDDQEARVRRGGLLGERVDDGAGLLVRAKRGGHRGEERRRQLLETKTQHVVLVCHQQARDRDRRGQKTHDHDREIREKEAAAHAAHQCASAGGISL